MKCRICPHLCELALGEVGKCLVRQNIDDEIKPTHYGECSIIAVEPIEKRPFFHYRPGTNCLSVGFLGCSISCPFCSNYELSQSAEKETIFYSPQNLVTLAHEKRVESIVFTYSEPTVHYEYIMDVARIVCKDSSLSLGIKTNGFVVPGVRDDLSTVFDAFNVDIKGDEEEYERCGGDLSVVLETIDFLYERGKHLEISYLVVPRLVENKSYHQQMLDWLLNKPDVPIHILYFYPFYKATESSYALSLLIPIIELFREKMKYVYLSNVFHPSIIRFRNSYCPDCGSLMVDRSHEIQIIKEECCENYFM